MQNPKEYSALRQTSNKPARWDRRGSGCICVPRWHRPWLRLLVSKITVRFNPRILDYRLEMRLKYFLHIKPKNMKYYPSIRGWGDRTDSASRVAYAGARPAHVHARACSRVNCVPEHVPASRDPSTSWRCHSAGAGCTTQY